MAAAAVLYVKDLTTMIDFYAHCCGLSAEQPDAGGYCVLTSPDWELSLVRIPQRIAATIVITDPAQRRQHSPVKLAFDVPDLAAAEAMVIAAGGQVEPGDPWAFRGHRHRDCVDPEGNVMQLRQRVPV